MTIQSRGPLNGKALAEALAELLRGDTWTVHQLSPLRLRIDHVRGLNLEPICMIDVDAAARSIEVIAPYPLSIPSEKSGTVSAYMDTLANRIHPMSWTLDRGRGQLNLTYSIEIALPTTLSEAWLIESNTKRRVRMWAQGCIDRLDRYASGLNGILAGMPLQDVMAEMVRAETEDAIFEANWLLGGGEPG